MVPGRGVCHAGRHVRVRTPVPGKQRDAFRGLLPVPGGTGAGLPAGRGPRPVPCVLRGATDGNRVLLRHDGQAPDPQHEEHARRSTGQCHGARTSLDNTDRPRMFLSGARLVSARVFLPGTN